ncbi:MAG: hypothetical protein HRT89_10515 [Lentisphaeria bacterium]|nr:hypothetical protein [Lentisphaeria bacterium]
MKLECWAALIKRVYEVDSLCCPHCGEQMRINSFIEARDQGNVIKDIITALWIMERTRQQRATCICTGLRIRAPTVSIDRDG